MVQMQEVGRPIDAPQSAASFSLVPQNLGQAMELAKMIAESDLAPKDYKNKPGNVLIAVQMGQEIGLSPMTAIQNIAVINGKPAVYGDSGKALLLARGFIIEEDDIEAIKANGMIGRCRITRPGHPPVERTFSKENAVKAHLWGKDGPWTTYPERQLAWRAFWFAARDCAADVLKGMAGIEELRDITPEREINPMPAREAPAKLPAFDDDKFKKNLPTYTKTIQSGSATADEVIAKLSSKYTLSEEQYQALETIKPATKEADAPKVDAAPPAATNGKPAVTFAIVEKRMRKAKDKDLLDAEADLIKEVADEGQRNELSAIYRELLKNFTQGE